MILRAKLSKEIDFLSNVSYVGLMESINCFPSWMMELVLIKKQMTELLPENTASGGTSYSADTGNTLSLLKTSIRATTDLKPEQAAAIIGGMVLTGQLTIDYLGGSLYVEDGVVNVIC